MSFTFTVREGLLILGNPVCRVQMFLPVLFVEFLRKIQILRAIEIEVVNKQYADKYDDNNICKIHNNKQNIQSSDPTLSSE